MVQTPITLAELNKNIKAAVKNNLDSYWLTAEISEVSTNYSGHCYLEFIQKNERTDKVMAKARAIIWSNVFRMIKPYFESTTGQSFEAGIKIMVRVVVEFHEVYGLSLNVLDIEPTYTVGEVAIRKQKIIEKLNQEGVLEMNKELELPYLLNRIAIISSKTAAGLGDFLDQIKNNPSGFKFYTKLYPAVMQGNEAESSIINQLDLIFQHAHFFDAVVIIRGGGSQSDLDCFNNYWLAYNITQFPLPVLTGIGHEQDDSVVDLVANTRLKTPTAVAEFLIDQLSVVENDLLGAETQIVESARDILQEKNTGLRESAFNLKSYLNETILKENKRLSLISSSYISHAKNTLHKKKTLLERGSLRIETSSKHLLKDNMIRVDMIQNQLKNSTKHKLSISKSELEIQEQSVRLNNPKEILKKGYSVTLLDGKSVKNSTELKVGDEIETLFHRGKKKSIIK